MMCPKCRRRLRADAEVCLCGWASAASSSQQSGRAECAHFGCVQTAMIAQRTRSGWANLCLSHYEAHHTAEAQRKLALLGLDTREKQTAYWREQVEILRSGAKNYRTWAHRPKSELARRYAAEINASKRLPVREPGADYEEDEFSEATA